MVMNHESHHFYIFFPGHGPTMFSASEYTARAAVNPSDSNARTASGQSHVVDSRSPTKDLEADAYTQVPTMDLDPLLRTRMQSPTQSRP